MTIEDPQTPEEEQQAWDEWVAGRPANLRAWLTEHVPTPGDFTCYRLAGTTGHYLISAFHTECDQETGDDIPDGGKLTVKVRHVHGPGARLVEPMLGIEVFGVPIEDLVKCGCRDFTPEAGL